MLEAFGSSGHSESNRGKGFKDDRLIKIGKGPKLVMNVIVTYLMHYSSSEIKIVKNFFFILP